MGDSYSQWLEEAFRWSAASPCWSEDEVEGFVASFQRLAAQKRAERAESEDTLAALLKRLSTDGAAGLRYVGWTVLSRLDDTESPTVDLTSTVVAQLDNLI